MALIIAKELLMAILTLIRLGFTVSDMEGKTADQIMAMAAVEEERAKALQARQEAGG